GAAAGGPAGGRQGAPPERAAVATMRRLAEAEKGAAAGGPAGGRQGAPPERAAVATMRRDRQRGSVLLLVCVLLVVLFAGAGVPIYLQMNNTRASGMVPLARLALLRGGRPERDARDRAQQLRDLERRPRPGRRQA